MPPGGKGDATQQPAQSALDAGAKPNLDPQLRGIVDQVSDYDTQYTLQVEETDTSSPLYLLRQERNGQAAVAIRAWLEREKPDLLIVPNGTILEMGVAWQIATQMGDQDRHL